MWNEVEICLLPSLIIKAHRLYNIWLLTRSYIFKYISKWFGSAIPNSPPFRIPSFRVVAEEYFPILSLAIRIVAKISLLHRSNVLSVEVFLCWQPRRNCRQGVQPNYHTRALRHVRKHLTTETAKTIAFSEIVSQRTSHHCAGEDWIRLVR